MPIMPKAERRSYEPNITQSDRRSGLNRWFYKSAPWRRVRAARLRVNKFCQCEQCQNGIPVLADTVDHIKRINPSGNPYDTEGGKWGNPLDFNNTKSYYGPHHNRKSGKEAHE